MELYENQEIRLVSAKIKMVLRVTPSICFGLGGISTIEHVALSDFAYGEYLFFGGISPVYYFNAFSSSIVGVEFRKNIECLEKKKGIDNELLALLKRCNILDISQNQCHRAIRFITGKSYLKEFTLLEIQDFEVER